MSAFPPEVRLNEEDHRVFLQAFDEATRRQLLEDDSVAWRGVCSILIAIVCLGLTIGIVAVIAAL